MFGNPLLRFYSPSLDSPVPLLPSDWDGMQNLLRSQNQRSSFQLEEHYQDLLDKVGNEISLRELKETLDNERKVLEEETSQPSTQILPHKVHMAIPKEKGGGEVSRFELEFPDLSKFDSSPYAEDILGFLNPFLEEMQGQGFLTGNKMHPDDSAVTFFVKHLEEYAERNQERTDRLKDTMKVKKLLVPYIESDLPGEVILEFNELEEGDPLVACYQFNPVIGEKIREIGVLLDRYDTSKEVLCLLVWSKYDNSLVCLPSVGLVPYPLCWQCKESFGMQACGKCGVAKYCGKECQMANWKGTHKILCKEMSSFARKHRTLIL